MIRPLGNMLLVLPEVKKVTKGGIVIPDKAQDKANIGLVLATGPGLTTMDGKGIIPLPVNPGDKIMFTKYTAREIQDTYEGEEAILYLLSSEDVWAVVTNDTPKKPSKKVSRK